MEKSYHFIGIGGIGMSALAQIALLKNYRVSGSDIEINARVESLVKAGAYVRKGHSEDHIKANMIVIYSSDIKKSNPEYQAALEKGCQIMHRADLLAEFIRDKKSLAIAGTHGKTTTSALLSTVVEEALLDPTYAIGGVLIATDSNSRAGYSDYFILEADESDQTFLKYHPYGAILTNIDHDHLINYENDFNQLLAAFKKFIDQIASSSHFFWCGDDEYLCEINPKGYSYGFSSSCSWRIVNARQEGFQLIFDLQSPNELFSDIVVNAIGKHNTLNAAAVFGLALSLGISEKSIRQSLRQFKGVKRRCEIKGCVQDLLFLDDYAHHPTEILTTLQGIKEAIGEKRLIAVFQPHRYSRTQECLEKYQDCFQHADEVIVTDIFAAGESSIPSLNGEKVMQEIKKCHSHCYYVPRPALSYKLRETLQANDVIVTLGAGDITKLNNDVIVLLDN